MPAGEIVRVIAREVVWGTARVHAGIQRPVVVIVLPVAEQTARAVCLLERRNYAIEE